MKILTKICRICLKSQEQKEELRSVFENDDESIKIAKKIYDVSGVFIEKNYNTPEKICRSCIKALNISYRFRQLCQQSDLKLKSSQCINVKTVIDTEDTVIDFVNDAILKVEQESEVLQSKCKDEDDETQNINNYSDLEIIYGQDYVDSEQFESQSNYNCKNQELHDEDELDESYEYLEETETVIFKESSESSKIKTIKDQHGRRLCRFKEEWLEKYDFLRQGNDNKSAICTACNCHLALAKGETTITRHIKTRKHLANIAGYPELNKNLKVERKQRTNKEEHVHICDICGNKYTTLHMLRRHIKYHSDIMDYECEICQKKFRQMMQLKRHMRIHTGEKPYSCKYCNKAIRDYSTKIRHERMHTGERPYVCTTCNKAFQYPFVLKNHLKTHTGEKLYECVICSKNFTLKKHLTSHLDTMLHKSRAKKFEEKI